MDTSVRRFYSEGKETILRKISPSLCGGLILENNAFIPGGYYSPQGEFIKMKEIEHTHYPRKTQQEWIKKKKEKEKALFEDYHNRINAPNVSCRPGKMILILDYEYEPEEDKDRNYSIHGADKKGVFAIMRIANRILGCDDSYYMYYKITCNYPDMIDTSVVKRILNETNPDYIWIIGFDLFNRMPFINGQGPDLVTKNGFARTYTIWDETTSKNILTLPMPHPRTPGFDSDVEKIWHTVLVELFKQ